MKRVAHACEIQNSFKAVIVCGHSCPTAPRLIMGGETCKAVEDWTKCSVAVQSLEVMQSRRIVDTGGNEM